MQLRPGLQTRGTQGTSGFGSWGSRPTMQPPLSLDSVLSTASSVTQGSVLALKVEPCLLVNQELGVPGLRTQWGCAGSVL